MKIVVTQDRAESYEWQSLEIVIDDKTKFNVFSGEDHEDNNLFRNFSDCYDIPSLLRKAYEAGKKGEELEIEYIELVDGDEEE